MDFLTLHEFSLHFDIPVRVLRYRLRQLLQAGKIIDGEDFRRDDYVDETHFVWKINSISFARLIGIRSVNNAATQAPSSAALASQRQLQWGVNSKNGTKVRAVV